MTFLGGHWTRVFIENNKKSGADTWGPGAAGPSHPLTDSGPGRRPQLRFFSIGLKGKTGKSKKFHRWRVFCF